MQGERTLLIPSTKCLRQLLQYRDHLAVNEAIVEQVQEELDTTVRVVQETQRLCINTAQPLYLACQYFCHTL